MPRGRPKKKDVLAPGVGDEAPQQLSPAPIFDSPSAVLGMDIPGLPPRKIKGDWNPEFFAELLMLPTRRAVECLSNGEKLDFPFAQFQKMVMDAAKMVGIGERDIVDRRTDAQRADDVWQKISADPESMFGIPDADLEALDRVIAAKEERMDTADALCQQELVGFLEEADNQYFGSRNPKAWRRRIARIIRLRKRARTPVVFKPGEQKLAMASDRPGLIEQAKAAAHLLRFMVYVGRAGMDQGEQFDQKKEIDPVDYLFDVSQHHARFAATLWIHRNGAAPIYEDGIGPARRGGHVFKRGLVRYQGSVQIMPIGHSKTELAIHWSALEIGLNPRDPGLYLQSSENMAIQNLASIKRFFDEKLGMGERYLSLFPCKTSKTQNDSTRIRLQMKNPPKSPNWSAAGLDSKKLGIDTDKQVFDDVIPQSDAYSETERKRHFDTLRGTFLSRKRSRKAFTLIIGNLWHYGDGVMQIISMARDAAAGKPGLVYGVCIQRCGGPKDTPTTKAWQPLWPKMYDKQRLKDKYAELGPSLYAAAMMCDPVTDEQRIVKKIRLYDVQSAEHKQFIESSIKYISLDPSATKNTHSDKAGIVYAGIGDFRRDVLTDHGNEIKMERVARLLRYHDIHATQSDLTDYTMTFAGSNPVDYVLVEAVGGFHGIVEMFRGVGIDAIPMQPRGKDKGTRLKGVAPILDDSGANLGFRATCEWPGIRNEHGVLELVPEFKPLLAQVIDFGVCVEDNGVDALTYLLGYLSPELSVGRGIVTQQVKRVEQEMGDPRLLAMYKSYERRQKMDRNASSEEWEHEWMRQNWQ